MAYWPSEELGRLVAIACWPFQHLGAYGYYLASLGNSHSFYY